MKQFKTLFIAALILFSTSQAMAQAKIAHVDTNEIMSKMPAMLDAQKQLENLGKKYDDDFRVMVEEYQAKLKKYDAEAATVSDKTNEDRAKEVQDMEKRIQDFRQNAQKELSQKEQDLVKPLMDKARAAIEKVGKAKGYQYVLDSSGLLLADGPDLTTDIKKELGF
ncbi:MAG: OmpH family outer membrane protein [Flavobacteriaceae bacterium]|nr:OmpH family outer membrane protein [Flavobacteriaceae bacterium]